MIIKVLSSQLKRHFTSEIQKAPKALKVSSEIYASVNETGYYSNAPVTLDNSTNPMVSRVLEEGKISLSDTEVPIQSAGISLLKELGENTLMADLGKTEIYQHDQILLKDVDPKNIPKDKDIILWGKSARIYAIGVPTSKVLGKNIHQQIFHEYKAGHGSKFTWKTYLKFSLFLPLLYYFAVYLEIVKEYCYVQGFYTALDRENMQLLKALKNTPRSTIEAQRTLAKFYPTQEK